MAAGQSLGMMPLGSWEQEGGGLGEVARGWKGG